MRTFPFALAATLALLVSGCRCSPATPVPITMNVVNGSKDPIFVDTTSGKLGLTVQRDVGGMLYPFDDLACPCLFCSNACDQTCECPDAGDPLIQRVGPGQTIGRPWSGVVQVSGSSSCSATGSCLNQENAPTNEPFTLHLCYLAQPPTGVRFDDAGVGFGQLPATATTCVDKQFMIQDGLVEIGPQQGAACTTTADCKGAELCFDGACTTGCPANGFPTGADFSLLVTSPDNMGFFTQSARPLGQQFTGSGTITSVVYVGTSLEVSLARPGAPGETLTGKLTVQLPPATGAPLQVGAMVDVLLLDLGKSAPDRAVVIRDTASKAVLFAADMSTGAPLLTTDDLAPLSTSTDTTPIGCLTDGCGKFLYFTRTFSDGAAQVTVKPGQRGSLTLDGGTWTVLSVNDGAYPTSTLCDVSEIRPFVLWRELP